MTEIYSRIGCAPCKTIKDYFNFKNHPYKEILDHQEPMAPVIKFPNGAIVRGLNLAEINRNLAEYDKAFLSQA